MKLTPKQRTTAQMGFLLSMHVEDIDDANDFIREAKTEDDIAEANRTLSLLAGYQEWLEMEVAACQDNE